MGTQANELSLGCDCLGQVHYLVRTSFRLARETPSIHSQPGAYIGHNGSAVVIENAICIHEEDAGVLWKHTDFRPGGRSKVVRSRRLVVSMVSTVANYGDPHKLFSPLRLVTDAAARVHLELLFLPGWYHRV
jgi:primary-amine oxidase